MRDVTRLWLKEKGSEESDWSFLLIVDLHV